MEIIIRKFIHLNLYAKDEFFKFIVLNPTSSYDLFRNPCVALLKEIVQFGQNLIPK